MDEHTLCDFANATANHESARYALAKMVIMFPSAFKETQTPGFVAVNRETDYSNPEVNSSNISFTQTELLNIFDTISNLINIGKWVTAIKEIRRITGADLKTAKNIVDRLRPTN